MICPKCHADYFENIKKCGDCNLNLVDACSLDIPIPDMTWEPLEPFQGKIYADMAAEILDNHDIPYSGPLKLAFCFPHLIYAPYLP